MTESTPRSARVERLANTVEEGVVELLSLGKLWASHGLTIGASSLAAGAKSLEVTSQFLTNLKDELQADDADAAAADEAADADADEAADANAADAEAVEAADAE